MLASGQRTAASWFRSAGVGDDWDRFYDCLQSVGTNVQALLLPLASAVVRRFEPGPEGRWRIALDDSPTRRYGRCVEAATMHQNPTPGPADGRWLYGHNWVCLALLARHAVFGMIALPLLSRLGHVKSTCRNMWKPYLNVLPKHARNAMLILEHIHAVAKFNKAIVDVRASEDRRLKLEDGDETLKHSR